MKKIVGFFKNNKTKNKRSSLTKNQEKHDFADKPLLTNIQENMEMLEKVFEKCSDIVFREIVISEKINGLLIFIDGLVDSDSLNEHVLYPFLHTDTSSQELRHLDKETVTLSQVSKAGTINELVDPVLSGSAVFLVNNSDEAYIFSVRGGNRRGVEEPQTEAAIRGPREGFTENIRTNTALVRFRIKSPKLKMEALVVGKHTRTNVVLAYMDGIIDPRVLKEVRARIDEIEIDSVLESGYLEELIEDNPYSPFPQMQYTERPDTASAQLLEGRFAIFVDGTPFVMTGPVTMWQLLQASEDYYERYLIANLLRWLRLTFIAIALFMPALYIAVTTYHQDMLPTNLLLSVAASREAIPFPAVIEALIMEIAFEALREAGIRLPKTVGQAVSILGALVIGQAAVQAGIVSAPMVIIVSLTGIASFTIPRFNFAISIRMLRFPLMLLAGAFGLFGIVVGTMLIAIHLCTLRSFGVPYLSGIAPFKKEELKDILGRTPWWNMEERPSSVAEQNVERLNNSMKPQPEDKQRR